MGLKKGVNNLFKVFLALIPNKYLRAKLKADWTKFHLKKYVNIAVQNYKEPNDIKYEINPPFFQYWNKGIENAPDIVKACVHSINKFEPEIKHIILDDKNLEDWVEIPSYIYDLKREGKIKIAQFSDIIRSCLLAQRPACWVDSTILFGGKTPSYVKENDFFMYKGINKTPEQFRGANYFIYSKKPNSLLIQLQNAILNYWAENDFLVSYFTHPHYISLLADINKDIWGKIPIVDENLTLLLSKILFNRYNEEEFKQIMEKCPIQKLTYKIPKKTGADFNGTYFMKMQRGENA